MNRRRTYIFLVLLFTMIGSAGILFAEVTVSYSSGNYNDDIFVTLDGITNNDEISYSFVENDPAPAIPYRGGMVLSAISGEERKYYLSFDINGSIKQFSYLIDKRHPLVPQIIYSELNDKSGYIFKENTDADIYYGYDEYNRDKTFQWEGELLSPPKSGFIYFYAEDDAGNKSETDFLMPEQIIENTYRYNLDIKSPVEGVFLNTQILYIEREGFEWIRYTLNGYDPVESGADYIEPVEIRRYGNVTLKIAAKPVNSDSIIKKEVNYQVNTKSPLKNIPVSGIYSEGITIKSYLNGYSYCLEDRSPGSDDLSFDKDLNINPIYGGVKYSTIRINYSEDPAQGDYRYFYVIDDRYPANPIINCSSRLPDENILDVSISGPSYSEIYYSTDGTTPGKTSMLYKEKFTIEVPENKNAGSIIIKARALSLNGKPSSVVSRIFAYDTQNPEKPVVDIERNNENGLYEIVYQDIDDEELFYALYSNGTENYPAKSDFRKVNRNDFFIDVPDGMLKEFMFIFASVDSTGNWSEFTEPITFTINKSIPEEPDIAFENNTITITSNYDVKYSYDIFKNGESVKSETGEYNSPIVLDSVYYNCTLNLNTEVSDDAGNHYKTSRKFNFPLKENQKEAVIFSQKTEDIYSGKEVSFYAYPDGIDDKLFYYLTEYYSDGTKNTQGPYETEGLITISGSENSKQDFYLEVFSVNEKTGGKSLVNSYEFVIDNEKPAVPEITGLENGAVVGDRVTVHAEHDQDSIVFLNYSDSLENIGYLFTKKSIVFNKPLVFDADDGEIKDVYLKIGAGDAAGNSVENPDIFHFKIDKKAPSIEGVNIFRDNTAKGQVVISVEGEEGAVYYYETGLKGEITDTPDFNSSFFTDSLKITNDKNTDENYIVKIIAADNAGNISRYPYSLMYNIDNLKPVVNDPEIITNDRYKKIFTNWPNSGDDDIFYRIIKDSSTMSDSEWTLYRKPFSIKYASDTSLVKIEYYSEDSNGNRSNIQKKEITLPTSVNTELVSGIENNSFYNKDQELMRLDRNSIIRYEISTEQVIPPRVSVFSPELPEILPFRIEDGESINYTVSLKEFRDHDDIIGGAEQVLKFTIDKQLPEPPVIGGISNGEYYLSDCNAYFQPSADKIFYTVSNDIKPSDNFNEYNDVFTIESPDGAYYGFTVKAYTQDFAGNRSAVKSWNITIDKEIIYVSAEGRDYYEGTRSKPFRSLSKALEQVKLSNRKTIFLEEGEYELKSPAVIDEAVTLYGGFRRGNWQEKNGETIINIKSNFVDENPSFYVYGGNLTIENIKINIAPEIVNSVFYVNKGNLNIRNSNVFINKGTGANLITQNYGKLLISNSIMSGSIGNKTLINNDYGSVNINSTDFNFTSEAEDAVLIQGNNCVDYGISSSEIKVSGARNITALKFMNSAVKLRADSIITDFSGVSATSIEAVDSRIDINYSKIISGQSNRISRVVVSEDSQLGFEGNTVELNAKTGMLGFNITGGNSRFINNHIKAGACNDFIYLFLLNAGQHRIETNILRSGRADNIVHFRTKASSLDFFSNTLVSDSGRNGTIGFKPEDESINRIINNIIYNNGNTDKTTLLFENEQNNMVSLKNNSLFGWENFTGGIVATKELISLDLIDGVYSAGRFSGNISEAPEKTFSDSGSLQLSEESACIDAGFDIGNILVNKLDIDGDIRPNNSIQRTNGYDIGADEFYR